MNSFLDSTEHLERELAAEPIAAPAAGAVTLHLVVLGLLISYAWVLGLFHHNLWGSPGAGGAMQVSITSALPLPAEQVNQNVLATETPSQAPAQPSPKEQHKVDETAIPIASKHVQQPKQQNVPKTQVHQPPQPKNTAQYGEQAGSSMPHQAQPGTVGQTTVGDLSFSSIFPWYVDQINRRMNQSWNHYEVDPQTPKGARVYIVFSIKRDGSVSGVRLERSSNSGTLDTSCLRAAQRVDTFGSLPPAYRGTTLDVEYYCEN